MVVFYSGLYGFVSVTGVRMAEAFGGDDPQALSEATRAGLAVSAGSGVLGAVLMLSGWFLLDFIGQPPGLHALSR